jgi:hypothetical protein
MSSGTRAGQRRGKDGTGEMAKVGAKGTQLCKLTNSLARLLQRAATYQSRFSLRGSTTKARPGCQSTPCSCISRSRGWAGDLAGRRLQFAQIAWGHQGRSPGQSANFICTQPVKMRYSIVRSVQRARDQCSWSLRPFILIH